VRLNLFECVSPANKNLLVQTTAGRDNVRADRDIPRVCVVGATGRALLCRKQTSQ
jgi:hypothetical protein